MGACGPITHDARLVIEQEAVLIRIENGIVFLAAIGIITALVNLQHSLYVFVGSFAFMNDGRVKEISQGFSAISAV